MTNGQLSQRRRRKAIFRTMRSRTQYGEKTGDMLLALGVLMLIITVIAIRWYID